MNPDVARLEAERLHPSPRNEQPTTEELIGELIHVLACALGVGRTPPWRRAALAGTVRRWQP